jgi:hypothetical protein
MPRLRNLINREVRRTRNIWALIKVKDRTLAECRVMDISHGGAKISTASPSLVPDRFELAFAEGEQPDTASDDLQRLDFDLRS